MAVPLEVIEGVDLFALRTPTLPPATTTNSALVGRRRFVVIEPATPHADEQATLDAAIAARIDAGAEVVGVVITHHHGDHVGYAAALRDRLGAPLFAHPATAARVPFAVDAALVDGDVIELGDGVALAAIHTPGHAPGHLVLHERQSDVVYAGDLVAGVGTILVDPSDDGDMAAYLASLEKIAALAPRRLIPAHGPVITEPAAHLRRTWEHRMMREERLLHALSRGPLVDDALLAAVYHDTPAALWPLARLALAAHLQKLLREGQVARDGDSLRLRKRGRTREQDLR
ncbi:MAG: MBL fold metallo-hydrolase [Nannocystis sp.]|nr:MBL fold metallo-hydrolase [Nannocystis sp.]